MFTPRKYETHKNKILESNSISLDNNSLLFAILGLKL